MLEILQAILDVAAGLDFGGPGQAPAVNRAVPWAALAAGASVGLSLLQGQQKAEAAEDRAEAIKEQTAIQREIVGAQAEARTRKIDERLQRARSAQAAAAGSLRASPSQRAVSQGQTRKAQRAKVSVSENAKLEQAQLKHRGQNALATGRRKARNAQLSGLLSAGTTLFNFASTRQNTGGV